MNELDNTQAEVKHLKEIALTKPSEWIETVFQCKLWSKQREIVNSVLKNPRTVVPSCSSSGKTFSAGHIAVWFLANYCPSTVITTAPTFRQVEAILWREIAEAWGKCVLPFEAKLTTTDLKMKDPDGMNRDWFAIGLSTDEPERFQGLHNKYVLVIGDEASGLPEGVYQAMENPLASGFTRLLLIGNPTQSVGGFRDAYLSPIYNSISISAFDTPNFEGITLDDIRKDTWKDKIGDKLPYPNLINPQWVSERFTEWGENSNLFQVYVLGRFPEAGERNLFRMSDIEAAIKRELNPEGDKIASVDISLEGGDETVYGTKMGNHVFPMKGWSHQDSNYTEGRIVREYRNDTPTKIFIEPQGIGGPVIDHLNDLGVPVTKWNPAEKAVDSERFLNLRAEQYWLLSRRFETGEIDIPDDTRLKAQLAEIQFDYTNGRMFIESKKSMKSRGVKSPDRADALMMLFTPCVKYGKPRTKNYL